MSVHEDLSRLLEGELDMAAEDELRARIAADPELRVMWERLQTLPFRALLTAEPPPALDARILASARPRRRWVRAIPWLIAAGALIGLAVREPPIRRAGAGEAIRIDVGESAEVVLQPPGESPMTKKTWLAGAGAAVTVTVLQGTATVSATEPAPLPTSDRPTAARSSAPDPRVAELERENALLRKMNADLEIELKGTPVPWPLGLQDALLPASFERNLRSAVATCTPEVEVVAIDCSEPPCLAALRVPSGPRGRNWHQALVNECPQWTEPYTNAVATASGDVECANGATERYHVLGWSTLGWPCERGGGRDVAIVLRKGSDNELSSGIDQNKVGMILSSPGVKKASDGQPLGVGEVAMIISLAPHAAPEGLSNVQVRGVQADVTRFRPNVKITEGRMFAPGGDEAIVGRAIAGRFQNLELGGVIEPKKNRPLKIVGVYEDGGSALESEVWADVDFVRAAFGREGMVSSVRARLESASSFDAFEASVEGDKNLGLEAMTEDEWNEKQSQGLAIFITVLGAVISFFFAIGASIGAMITMYGSVANRGREIGTLRAIGFPRRYILLSFVIESLLISLIGGVLGSIAALGMGFVKFSMLNFATFSEMVFRFHPTPTVFAISLGFALVMGLIGGLLPAIRAARVSPVQAMRN